MGQVIQMDVQPKTITGQKGNAKWVIRYSPTLKKWSWHVTVVVEPQHFTGTTDTKGSAEQEVAALLSLMKQS